MVRFVFCLSLDLFFDSSGRLLIFKISYYLRDQNKNQLNFPIFGLIQCRLSVLSV